MLDSFQFIDFEKAKLLLQNQAQNLIDVGCDTYNTVFIGFFDYRYADGSEIVTNLLKPLFEETNKGWRQVNFLPSFKQGLRVIKTKGSQNDDIKLQNIVLVDDFIGTGKTAKDRIERVKQKIGETDGGI
nr:phosphoribosyltransferase [Nonlabens ulvanivorans]